MKFTLKVLPIFQKCPGFSTTENAVVYQVITIYIYIFTHTYIYDVLVIC